MSFVARASAHALATEMPHNPRVQVHTDIPRQNAQREGTKLQTLAKTRRRMF